MRIKNVGRSTIIFNGGSLEAGKVAVFNGDAEKIGAALLKAYIVDVVVESPVKAEPKKSKKK